MNIVILDARTVTGTPADLDWKAIEATGHLTVYQHTSPSQVVERISGADAVLTNKVVINSDTMEACPSLRYIGVLATGFNVVDIPEASRRGITVTNIPGYGTASVVQHVFALLLNVTNQVAYYANECRAGRWSRSEDFCFWDSSICELAGRRMGIVGMGNIGTAVSRVALAMGMEAVATTRRKDLPQGVKAVELDELLETSDIVSLNCPLTDNNKGFINSRSLSLMKPNAILINTGRGPLVVEEDVAAALHESRLGAYCADVLAHEPALPDNPLLSAPRCYLTPHIAWASREARARLIAIAASNLTAYSAGNAVNVVNQPIP